MHEQDGSSLLDLQRSLDAALAAQAEAERTAAAAQAATAALLSTFAAREEYESLQLQHRTGEKRV